MVDWHAYLDALAVDEAFSPSEAPPPFPPPAGSSSAAAHAEYYLLPAVLLLLPRFLSQPASEIASNLSRSELAILLRGAGGAQAEQARGAGLSLAVCLEAQGRIRDNLLHLACRILSPADLPEALAKLLKFSDRITQGLVEEWSRLKSQHHRRRHQEARSYILRDRKRYDAVFRRMEEPAFVVDGELRLLDVNPAFEKFFGKSARECLGSTCMTTIGHGFCAQCPLAEIIDAGGSFAGLEVNLEVGAPKAAGEPERRTVLMSGTSLGEDGEGDGAIVLLQDITEQKLVEEELEEYRSWLEDMVDERTEELSSINRKLKKEVGERRRVEKELIRLTASLKQSNAELEQFAYVASHDLKEPLMLITAFAERLQHRYSSVLDERGREYVDRISKLTGKLRELVESLLQLSRVSTSQRPFERLQLDRLVREVLDDLSESIESTQARIDLVDLPDLNGDPVQLRQLFQNLIANALKYKQSKVAPEIVINSQLMEDGTCEISIADNGIGLSEEDVGRIFEPFVRLHGREIYEGSGMGLATCRKIVARHGGEIKAVSRPGQGALFVIRLPLRQSDPDQQIV